MKLVRIHAFPNGNGRHARFCADRLAENLRKPAFSWVPPLCVRSVAPERAISSVFGKRTLAKWRHWWRSRGPTTCNAGISSRWGPCRAAVGAGLSAPRAPGGSIAASPDLGIEPRKAQGGTLNDRVQVRIV